MGDYGNRRIGGSIGTGWVLSGYARYGAYTGVRAKVADLSVEMQNLSLITLGTGASLTFFPDETAGSYLGALNRRWY